MKNKELGRLVVKHIEAFPESFRMDGWVADSPCGVVACLAGHALLLSGKYRVDTGVAGWCVVRIEDGVRVEPGGTAMRELGLSPEEMFGGNGNEPYLFDGRQDPAVALARFKALLEEEDPA